MKFSSKVLKCGLSPMRKFHPYAVAAEAKGKKIYHLNIGQPDIETPKAYFDAVKHFDLPVLEYAPSPGIPALIDAIPAVKEYVDSAEGDEKTGAAIVLKALEEPVRQIAANAGIEGSVIVEQLKKDGKVGYGYNALTGEFQDMIEAGIVDPTKVTRSALQNASSVAATILTTESLVADIKEPAPAAAPAGGDMGGMY